MHKVKLSLSGEEMKRRGERRGRWVEEEGRVEKRGKRREGRGEEGGVKRKGEWRKRRGKEEEERAVMKKFKEG